MLTEDRSGTILKSMLDLTAKRQDVLNHNLSNANTPDYKRLELDFSAAFADAVKNQHEDLSTLAKQFNATEDPNAVPRADGNSVVLEQELSELSKNALLYQTVIQIMSRRAALLRTAITGRS